MNQYRLAATAAFGLEWIVARELKGLGFRETVVENGRVSFAGGEKDIAKCNIWLRTADRVLIEMARFSASDFEELFQGVLAVPWEEMVPLTGAVHVTGKSVRSKLSSVPACQSVVKKAVIEGMKRKHRAGVFNETGPRFGIEVSLNKDVVTIDMDTTGPGLHKRGYRTGAGEAAIKETLAAGLVYLSRWKPGAALADPFCGSGTIAIEAAMIGRNIAPGITRRFASEEWPFMPAEIWEDARREAAGLANRDKLHILASDIDETVISKARRNARHAGVLSAIDLSTRDFKDFPFGGEGGVVVSNPPYGERSGDRRTAIELARDMGAVFTRSPAWSFFILTGFEEFEKHYGRHADSNRKLYNGRIKCYLYGYFGSAGSR
ncbi:MAG: class I SAM-dependent RNA methyltransferase [Syntrophorhabdaceae bacterium]|nr:class I SAM-dependent RNA methyltransferase [Syntrophorhabdaceae bacterium]